MPSAAANRPDVYWPMGRSQKEKKKATQETRQQLNQIGALHALYLETSVYVQFLLFWEYFIPPNIKTGHNQGRTTWESPFTLWRLRSSSCTTLLRHGKSRDAPGRAPKKLALQPTAGCGRCASPDASSLDVSLLCYVNYKCLSSASPSFAGEVGTSGMGNLQRLTCTLTMQHNAHLRGHLQANENAPPTPMVEPPNSILLR